MVATGRGPRAGDEQLQLTLALFALIYCLNGAVAGVVVGALGVAWRALGGWLRGRI